MSKERHKRADLVALFRSAIGEATGDKVVSSAASRLGLSIDSFTLDEALAVLEQVATEPGLVGIIARFAKTRIILSWSPRARVG
jgi:hypothetical protein